MNHQGDESSGAIAWMRAARSATTGTILVHMALAIALFVVLPERHTNPFNGPMVIAGRLLQGEASLPDGIGWMETFTFEGRLYLAYPPMVSFLLVPWAALTGEALGQAPFNAVLIFASALLVGAIFRRIPVLERFATLATVAYVLGTPQLYSARYGTVWLLMHSESNCFFLLAIYLVVARRAYGWAGFCFCIAAQTRYAVAVAAPVFGLLAVLDPARRSLRDTLGRTIRFGLGALPPLGLVVLYQWWVFGSPFLNTYVATWSQWSQPAPGFGTANVVRNLWFYLTAMPEVRPDHPYLRFDAGGQAAWLMSPFLVGVLAPWLRSWHVRALLPGAILMFVFYLFYSWQGFAQFGSRYMQDLYPLFFPVAFSAFARPSPWLPRALHVLVAAAIAINLYGFYCVTQYP